MPKSVYRYVLGILRTAESAVRRLIIAAARNIVVEPRKAHPAKPRTKASSNGKGQAECKGESRGKSKRKRKRDWLFRLFDPPKRENRAYGRPPKRPQVEPRIHVFGYDPRIPEFLRGQPAPPSPPVLEEKVIVDDGTVNARHLCRRLLAIVAALQDIPRQARRYARWRDTPIEDRHPQRESALRFGRPPGFRQRPKHEVDEILKECHWLARNAEPVLDTS